MTDAAKLVVVTGSQKALAFDISAAEVQIGRESTNDIEIRDLSVSRRHCKIRHNDSGFVLSSLDSTNGTQVNGVPVVEWRLEDGDVIRLGNTTLRFVLLESEPAPVPLDTYPLSLKATTRLPAAQSADPETLESHQVHGLFRLSQALNSATEVEAVQRLFVNAALCFTGADRAAFVHPRTDPHNWIFSLARDSSGWLHSCFPISSTILKEVTSGHYAILVEDLSELDVLSESLRSAGVCSLIALPMHVFGNLYGILYLDASKKRLTPEHLHWLASASGMVTITLENRLNVRALKSENRQLKAESQQRYSFIGNSMPMRDVYRQIAKIAQSDATVLIFGESGTGKEVAARAIHENSARHANPFIAVNCALLNESLLESDLFGHEKGAFTGALQQKKGKLELAEGGTLFLDELGELSLSIQAKLLRVIQERRIERLGGTSSIPIDVRILGATHRDLEEAVSQKAFRHDLYFRLKVISLVMPPLRDRREDIPDLVDHLLQRRAQRSRRRIESIEPEAIRLLKQYNWPGNVRELENVLEHALVMGEGSIIRAQDLPEALFETDLDPENKAVKFYNDINRAKQRIIRDALADSNWNYTHAAAALGINRTYLHRLVRSLQITPHT